MLANPVQQGPFKTDIVTQSLGLDPLVTEDFLTFGQKFLIETRLLHKLMGRLIGF